MNNHGEKASPDAGRIAYLVHGFLKDKLTDAERDELDEWIEATPENMKLFEELTDGENLQAAQSWFQNQQQNEQRKRTRYQAIRRSIRRSVPSVVWYLAAACIVALLIGVYWLTKIKNEPVAPPIARGGVKVSPEPNQGILILSNGQKVPLDNVQTIRQQNFTVENGSIVYSRRPSTDTRLQYRRCSCRQAI
jgi:transmembrane sensor